MVGVLITNVTGSGQLITAIILARFKPGTDQKMLLQNGFTRREEIYAKIIRHRTGGPSNVMIEIKKERELLVIIYQELRDDVETAIKQKKIIAEIKKILRELNIQAIEEGWLEAENLNERLSQAIKEVVGASALASFLKATLGTFN